MQRQLITWLSAMILIITSTAAMADRKGHRDHKLYHQYDNRHGHQRWQPSRQRVTQIHKHYRNDYSGYLGAALLGSAITYTLVHRHNGADCHDNHGYRDTRDYRDRYSNRYDVVGCQRIERYANGSERRVSVPLSQCR